MAISFSNYKWILIRKSPLRREGSPQPTDQKIRFSRKMPTIAARPITRVSRVWVL